MTEMNFEQARFNMIEQQIRPAEVLDQKVLDIIANTPREDFVPEKYRKLAFADINIPLEHGQVMMTPILEARLLQALNIQPTESVLEVGTGSGYLTACLAKLARHVYSVEIFSDFSERAKHKLNGHSLTNVTLDVGDASNGWEAHAPYDVITLTGSLMLPPESFKHCLNVGGRMFAIVGEPPVREGILITRVDEHQWSQESLMETDIPPLLNAPQPQRFVL